MVTVAVPLTFHAGGQTCVWMDAGVMGFRLCDRGYDCENCPLDAALRGVSPVSGRLSRLAADRGPPVTTFPDDRLYSPGHTWVLIADQRSLRVRVGIDGFAAPLLGRPTRVEPLGETDEPSDGGSLCLLEVQDGWLAIGSPIRGRVVRWNADAVESASLIASDPYGEGWLAELVVPSREALSGLMLGDAARQEAVFDARRYRRRIAYELLADAGNPDLPEWSEWGTDLSRLLSPERFLTIVREFLH